MRNGAVPKLKALDFFAGSGLVTEGLSGEFRVVWANDICPKKARVYIANFGEETFCLRSIEKVNGRSLPSAHLAWASFPCQDLSLAGKMNGLERGTRSGLFWEWLRVMDEMPSHTRPAVVCLENVVGFLMADQGRHFNSAYYALRERGYLGGAFILDARRFVPQSRPRAFLVAVKDHLDIEGFAAKRPVASIHGKPVMNAWKAVNDSEWVFWRLPRLPRRLATFSDICDREAETDSPEVTAKLLSMLSEVNRKKLDAALASKGFVAGTGYKRIRREADGEKRQRLEIRFDGQAGCLRVPSGGSSRQIVVLVDRGTVRTRLLTIKEAARLMGVRPDYWLPQSYNEAYWAMADAVAVPVTRFIAKHLLAHVCSLARAFAEANSSGNCKATTRVR